MYVSSASAELTEDSLHQILANAQSNNAARGITGLLLHADGNLMQLIEGPQSAVEALFEKISQDRRHKQVMVLFRKAMEKRDFPEFKMGFRRVSRDLVEEMIPAFTDIVEKRQLDEQTLKGLSQHVSIFLRSFARTTGITSMA